MEEADLKKILKQKENPNVEFKSEWYKIDNGNQNTKETARHEMIRDILSLVNGNPSVAGKPSYLIIGAADTLDEYGERALFDIDPTLIERSRILGFVNSVCKPPVPNIDCIPFPIKGKTIVVLEISPSYHLHETTQSLITKVNGENKTKLYQKYTVFVRHGESIGIADQQERETIIAMKHARFMEARKVRPAPFGAAIGAIVGGLLLPPLAEKVTGKKDGFWAGTVIGPIVGGFTGGSFGNGYEAILEVKRDWKTISPINRVLLLGGIAVTGMLYWNAWGFFNNKRKKG